MRGLFTIAWYEFRMQIKSLRFKGLVLLIGLFEFAMIQEALVQQTFQPRQNILNEEVLKVYLGIVVFAGLFSMGRIRSTGMQPILMTKPFQTFTLMTGLLLGALASLVILMFLILFPLPITLNIFTNAEIFYRPLCHIILFFMIPAACGVLAITLWVRTCFKNNITALIIIGGIIAGLGLLANSVYINVPNQYHYYTPLVSLFSFAYRRQLDAMQQSPAVSFTDLTQWWHWGMNLLPSAVFLGLACYHLRRSEPQRKVLGNYGRRWYHAPTYMKLFCDLKIDPSITWRSHMATLALIIFIILAGINPMSSQPPWVKNAKILLKHQNNPGQQPIYVRGDLMHEGGLLPVTIIHSRQHMEKERLETQLTFTIDPNDLLITTPEASTEDQATTAITQTLIKHKYAELNPLQREQYQHTQLSIKGHDIPYEIHNGHMMIKDENLKSWADGKEHILDIKATHDPNVIINDWQGDLLRYATQGHNFVEVYQQHVYPNGTHDYRPSLFHKTDPWPIDMTIVLDSKALLIEAPVDPTVDRSETQAAFHFALPPAGNSPTANITFAPNGNYSFVEYDRPGIKIKFALLTSDLKIFNELLELADPVIQEFCALKRIHFEEPILIRFDRRWIFRMIRWTHEVYRKRGMLRQHEERTFYYHLDRFEEELLDKILSESFSSNMAHQNYYMLNQFLQLNRVKGLNHRIAANHPFESEAHMPISDSNSNNKPIFQMLYWIMGHEKFYDMLEQLRSRMKTEVLDDTLIRDVTNSVSEEPLDDFFDYWLPKDNEDTKNSKLPSYKILTATADTLTTGTDETTIYKVRVEFQSENGVRMPLPIRLVTTDQPINARVDIGGNDTAVWEATSRQLPQAVVVDPDNWIPKASYWDEEIKSRITNAKLPVTINAKE